MRRLLAALVIVLAFACSAWADDRAACVKVEDPDRSIRACTNMINGGWENRANLAVDHNNRGVAYTNKGDYDHAFADLDKALELTPDYAAAYYNRGNAYIKKGDYGRAIADLDKAIELKPDLAIAYYDRGTSYIEKGDYDRAIADFDRAIELKPDLAVAYNNRGSVYNDRGDYDRAIADENKAIKLKPDFGHAYYWRAKAHAARGDTTKALIDFHVAAQLIPKSDQLRRRALDEIASAEATSGFQATPTAPAVVAPAPASKPPKEPLDISAYVASPRVALVIGNGAYQNVAQLTNPTNDATLVSDALKLDGFTVTLADDLDHEGFIKALKAFASEADNADWAVVYFAGHGIEMAGTNYLIPVDAKLATDRDVGFEAIPIDQVMTAIDGAHELRVVILDACRDNPFAAAMKRVPSAGRNISRGLARVEPSQGTVIVYSAKPGQIAADGDGADSPFATALAHHLTERGVEVLKLFRLVRDDVLAATGNQEVFADSSLPGKDFFFRLPVR